MEHLTPEVKEKFSKQLSAAKMLMNSYSSASFFSFVLYNLRIYPDVSITTAGTDGLTLVINPEFFESLSPEHRIFLLLHETMHVCLKHVTRKQSRDHRVFNIAADYVINLSLKDYGIQVPDMALIDSKYRGMTTEAVYELLVKEQDNTTQPDFDDLMKPGSLPGSQNGQSQTSNQTQADIVESAINDILKSAETAALMGGKDLGNLPAELQRHIHDLAQPKLPWNIILANFLYESSKNGYSFKRPNRKFFPQFYLPSLYSEGLSRIDFILDTSGSVSESEFNQYVSEVDKVLKQFQPEEIGFSQFDTRFHGTQMIDKFTDIKEIEFRGGGGTDITSTLKAVEDYPTKCLIIFTDGYLDTSHLPEPKVPTVWCVHSGHKDFTPPFGKVIHFDLNELG